VLATSIANAPTEHTADLAIIAGIDAGTITKDADIETEL
jgi:hypothetical protein